ncbi:hypothetical protein D6D19_07996 [Aureobasidium pullulans]|uniref:BTB domain-containing protein n=1 Tax=Aureobasidium pullulans TaxID=5580 RepID=A0A4S8ZUR8_AURPU|nr:hypothetical protein D6D19_07996 [Aureobasidium pullulans]
MSTPLKNPVTSAPSKGAVSTPDKLPSSKHFKGLVTIIVGRSEKHFTVHKELLIFYSDYFRAAFNGSFVEAAESKIELLDVAQEVFEHFHAWLYTRRLVSEDEKPLMWLSLAALWVFGDRFQVPMLQNCVADELFAKRERDNRFPLGLIKYVNGVTPVGSPLRRITVNIIIHRMGSLGEPDNPKSGILTPENRHFWTIEILEDLLREADAARHNKLAPNKLPKRDKCFFHVHGKDEHC